MLANLQEFWRYHVAPATNRRIDTHLDVGVDELITQLAQRSYEVYANVYDALDELLNIDKPKPPRYRSCLNILRCMGDACSLFDDLIKRLGEKADYSQADYVHYGTTQGVDNLAKKLGVKLVFFKDWSAYWSKQRMHVADYRHMLVHHGRPWLFFDGDEHDGWPYVLIAEHCRRQGCNPKWPDYLSWNGQKTLFAADRSKFVPLPDVCRATCSEGIKWLNRAYGRINAKMDEVLSKPDTFDVYKRLWGFRD
jgi:hypothetical protein